MTEMLVQSQPSLTKAAAEPELPGISAVELDVMQAAAARFLEGRDTGIAGGAVATIEDMQALREPAGAQAAGAVSARRDDYRRQHGAHFMIMPYYAD
jgi:hypothetical protein